MLSRCEGQEALETTNEILENRGTIPIPKKQFYQENAACRPAMGVGKQRKTYYLLTPADGINPGKRARHARDNHKDGRQCSTALHYRKCKVCKRRSGKIPSH